MSFDLVHLLVAHVCVAPKMVHYECNYDDEQDGNACTRVWWYTEETL